MKIIANLYVKSKRDGSIWSNLSGQWKQETNIQKIYFCKKILKAAKSRTLSDTAKKIIIDQCKESYHAVSTSEVDKTISEENQNSQMTTKQLIRTTCDELINFFKDFNFEPNFRFVNTLKKNASSVNTARKYICNYFNLIDNQFKEDIAEKTKSQEFKNIISKLQQINTSTTINSRFKVYYGSQGTGKTTKALEETNNVVMVCHSAMLPSDLLEDFKFEEGKPTFKHSALWNAMENGTKITLDEINLLPFESLRFLQSILDNKKEINYKGQVIHIKDGFQIIGTMNLTVNGNVFNLPEPLVDRASELEEYKLDADKLMGALL